MKRVSSLLSSIVAIAVIAVLAVAAAGSTQGTAVYRIQEAGLSTLLTTTGTSSSTSTVSYTVTEKVSPGPNASFDTLFLALASNAGNFTYSRLVNSSLQVQPFLPAITNQSFLYNGNGSSISFSIARNGTVPVVFQGQSYSMASYAISVEITGPVPNLSGLNLTGTDLTIAGVQAKVSALPTSNVTTTMTGSVYAFPSGLVYSAKGDVQGQPPFSITLLSTTLPLNGPGPSAATQVASIGVGAGAIASALALALGVRHRKQVRKAAEAKPDHWVD